MDNNMGSWGDDFLCLDHDVFFNDLIVEDIVKLLQPLDLIACRLLTRVFNCSAARWIKMNNWFVINFEYNFLYGIHFCSKRTQIEAVPDQDSESGQSQSHRAQSSYSFPQNHKTLESLSKIIQNSYNFPFTKMNFATIMPKSEDLKNFVALHGKQMNGLPAPDEFVPIQLSRANENLSLPLPSFSQLLSSLNRIPELNFSSQGRIPSYFTVEEPQDTGPKSSTSKDKKKRTCMVCGGTAICRNFGVLSCDSCRAFFVRSVSNNAYLRFTCAAEQNCKIEEKIRKMCQKCRFVKCELKGMDKTRVKGYNDDAYRTAQVFRQQENEEKEDTQTQSTSGQQRYTTPTTALATACAPANNDGSITILELENPGAISNFNLFSNASEGFYSTLIGANDAHNYYGANVSDNVAIGPEPEPEQEEAVPYKNISLDSM